MVALKAIARAHVGQDSIHVHVEVGVVLLLKIYRAQLETCRRQPLCLLQQAQGRFLLSLEEIEIVVVLAVVAGMHMVTPAIMSVRKFVSSSISKTVGLRP